MKGILKHTHKFILVTFFMSTNVFADTFLYFKPNYKGNYYKVETPATGTFSIVNIDAREWKSYGFPNYNDLVSSYKVNDHDVCFMYDGKPYFSGMEAYTYGPTSIQYLSDDNFNNAISSFAVFRDYLTDLWGSCAFEYRAMFYGKPNRTGEMFPLFLFIDRQFDGEGLPKLMNFNDRVSSVFLPANTTVCLFKGKDYQGDSLELSTPGTEMIFNLSDYGFDDQVTSFKPGACN